MSLYRCKACGSPHVIVDTQKEGYSYVKGAIGTIAFGTGGAAAGVGGKTVKVYKCPDCGLTLNEPMAFEIKTLIDIGVASVAHRDNLMLAGVKVDWEYFLNKYKNIEKTADDSSVKTEILEQNEPIASENIPLIDAEELEKGKDIYETAKAEYEKLYEEWRKEISKVAVSRNTAFFSRINTAKEKSNTEGTPYNDAVIIGIRNNTIDEFPFPQRPSLPREMEKYRSNGEPIPFKEQYCGMIVNSLFRYIESNGPQTRDTLIKELDLSDSCTDQRLKELFQALESDENVRFEKNKYMVYYYPVIKPVIESARHQLEGEKAISDKESLEYKILDFLVSSEKEITPDKIFAELFNSGKDLNAEDAYNLRFSCRKACLKLKRSLFVTETDDQGSIKANVCGKEALSGKVNKLFECDDPSELGVLLVSYETSPMKCFKQEIPASADIPKTNNDKSNNNPPSKLKTNNTSQVKEKTIDQPKAKKEINKKHLIIIAVVCIIVAACVALLQSNSKKASLYAEALNHEELAYSHRQYSEYRTEEFEEAIAKFNSLKNYEDSKEHAEKIKADAYNDAFDLLNGNTGDWGGSSLNDNGSDNVLRLFAIAEGYKDSQEIAEIVEAELLAIQDVYNNPPAINALKSAQQVLEENQYVKKYEYLENGVKIYDMLNGQEWQYVSGDAKLLSIPFIKGNFKTDTTIEEQWTETLRFTTDVTGGVYGVVDDWFIEITLHTDEQDINLDPEYLSFNIPDSVSYGSFEKYIRDYYGWELTVDITKSDTLKLTLDNSKGDVFRCEYKPV